MKEQLHKIQPSQYCLSLVFVVLAIVPQIASADVCTGNSSRLADVDCYTWQFFYDHHGGAQWTKRVVPVDARTNPCSLGEYYNVRCDGNRITHIDLLEVGVTGTLSDAIDSLRHLANLTVLELYGNDLSGTLPSAIGSLTQLTYLDLERNRLTGTVPPALAKLRKLTTLYLACNQLSGGVPNLPFKQYKGDCIIASKKFDAERGCRPGYGPMRLACPLPANAADCRWTSGRRAAAGTSRVEGSGGLDECGG